MRKLSFLFAALAVLLVGLAPAARAQGVPAPFDEAFTPTQLLTLHLEMDPGDWSKVASDLTNSIYKPALFWAEEDQDGLGNPVKLQVAVRRKSSRDLGTKVSLKIDINQIVDGQRWRSLNKLSLENGADNGVVEEGLAWQLHRMASYAATGGTFTSAYAAWVKLYVNGAYLGVYASVEQRDKQMLRNRLLWDSTKTWLYEQDDMNSVVASEGAGNSPAFATLCFSPFLGAVTTVKIGKKTVTVPCPTPEDALLPGVLDANVNMDAMLAQAAVDAYLGNNDALFTHGKNFMFVDFAPGHDEVVDTRRLYFPWDLDTGFKSTSANIYSQKTQTAYQRIILNHPVYRVRYNALMESLVNGPLSGESLNSFIDDIEMTLAEALATDPNLSADWEGFGKLRSWVIARAANIRMQILSNQPYPR